MGVPNSYVVNEQRRRVPIDSPYGRRLSDFKAASLAIGDTSTSRLTWVVRFIRERPAEWHSSTAASLGDSLLVLAGHGFPANLVGGVPLPSPLSREVVEAIHRELREVLRAAVTSAPGSEDVPLALGELTVSLVRLTKVSVKPAIWGLRYGGASHARIVHKVKDLIVESGDRLIACKFCREPIVSNRKQEYCDATCSQQARNHRKDQRKGGRRTAHAQKTRKG